MSLTGADVREIFEAVLPEAALREAMMAAQFQQRERKLDALALLRTTILTAASGSGGRQADVMKAYFRSGAPKVVRGGFYGWFGPAFERTMDAVCRRALAFAAAEPLDLPGALGAYVRDWHIVDSMTVQLEKELQEEYPGAGDYAALKVHKRYSVGVGTTIAFHLSPAREHDAPHLTIDESWRGLGLLCDLGYASHDLLRACAEFDVRYVIRLKENWKARVTHIARGQEAATFVAGTDFDQLRAEGVIRLDGRVIDLDVDLGSGRKTFRARLVGVHTDKGYCFYLTNLPPKAAPRTVADLYRIRWEIELDNKLDKSCHRLDEIGARTGPAVRALVYASIVASILACLVVHRHRLREAPPPRKGTERTKPPIHAQGVARMMAVSAPCIARTFDLRGKAADAEWEQQASCFRWETDPNWRRRPSILDQMRGWRVTPGVPRKGRIARASLK